MPRDRDQVGRDLLQEFSLEQRRKSLEIARRRDAISLEETIEIVDRILADYQKLRESLVLVQKAEVV